MTLTDERILHYKIQFQTRMNEFTELTNYNVNLKSNNSGRPLNKFSILRNHILNQGDNQDD